MASILQLEAPGQDPATALPADVPQSPWFTHECQTVFRMAVRDPDCGRELVNGLALVYALGLSQDLAAEIMGISKPKLTKLLIVGLRRLRGRKYREAVQPRIDLSNASRAEIERILKEQVEAVDVDRLDALIGRPDLGDDIEAEATPTTAA